MRGILPPQRIKNNTDSGHYTNRHEGVREGQTHLLRAYLPLMTVPVMHANQAAEHATLKSGSHGARPGGRSYSPNLLGWGGEGGGIELERVGGGCRGVQQEAERRREPRREVDGVKRI